MKIKLKEKFDMNDENALGFLFGFITCVLSVVTVAWLGHIIYYFITWSSLSWDFVRFSIVMLIAIIPYLLIFFNTTTNHEK